MTYAYFKNTFVPKVEAVVSIDDRSFRFGDGVFETILVTGGRMYDAPAHFRRLRDGLDYFNIPLDTHALPDICAQLIEKNALAGGYVRIIVSRGENGAGAIGYKPGDSVPYMAVQTVEKPFPPYAPLRLWVSSHAAAMHLPGKVNSAMLYVMAMAEADAHQCDNAIILNTEGTLCETASGNLFWVRGGTLYTPATDLPFVPGTVRNKVIALSPYPVKEGHYRLNDLKHADEILMTNIGTLIAPITSIEPLGYTAKGDEVTRKLRELLEGDIKQHSSPKEA